MADAPNRRLAPGPTPLEFSPGPTPLADAISDDRIEELLTFFRVEANPPHQRIAWTIGPEVADCLVVALKELRKLYTFRQIALLTLSNEARSICTALETLNAARDDS